MFANGISLPAQKSPAERGSSAKHERQGVRRSKNKFTWFSSSDSVSVLSQYVFSAASVSLASGGSGCEIVVLILGFAFFVLSKFRAFVVLLHFF